VIRRIKICSVSIIPFTFVPRLNSSQGALEVLTFSFFAKAETQLVSIIGGGGNFGIVAEFVLRLHPQRKTVFAGVAIFPPNLVEKILPATDDFFKNNKSTKGTAIVMIVNPPPERKVRFDLMVIYFSLAQRAKACCSGHHIL
jgi:hypothetical protein